MLYYLITFILGLLVPLCLKLTFNDITKFLDRIGIINAQKIPTPLEDIDIDQSALDYFNALGKDHFDDLETIDFNDENNKGRGQLIYLTNKELMNMDPRRLHKYLLKLLYNKGDYFDIIFKLPEKMIIKTSEKTNKAAMINFINHVIILSEKVEKQDTRDTFNSLLSPMLGSMSAFSMPNGQSFNNFNNSISSTSSTQVQELTELEKEMKSITDS